MNPLEQDLDSITRTPVLLVASDYDGTVAPIVDDPERAEPRPESIVAIKSLAVLPQTVVAIISSRSRQDLERWIAGPELENVRLVGSHGSEFRAGFVTPLPPGSDALLAQVKAELKRIATGKTGFILQEKPASVAFHYRTADEHEAAAALDAIITGPGRWSGVFVRRGKKVIELSIIETNKGRALDRLRQRFGATAVLFIGDDATDEDAFATLGGPDVGVKVGAGATAAKHRVVDTLEVARILATVAERRSEWLAGSEAIPIEHHSYLSDQRTGALVTPRGRIAWLCLPRIDSPAIFSELLGGPTSGFFEIAPATDSSPPPRQSYVGDSFILTTDWGGLRVTDYLDSSGGRAFQRAGRSDLIRIIEGHGRARITFAPRIDFGQVETRLREADGGLIIEGSVDPCVLVAPDVRWKLVEEGKHQTAVGEIDMNGDAIVLELRYGTGNTRPSAIPERSRREQTERFWTVWSNTLKLPSVCPDLVRRSALVLRAISYGPTGAIAAAGTTSLPEHAGGVRNWDYRFCWPRDAAMSAAALVRLGANGPAMKFLDWVLGILEQLTPPAMIRPVYSVTGGHLGAEGTIAELAGYRGSRPVRIGNAAAHQIQLDVLGPIADLLALLADRGAALSSEHWRMLEAMVAMVAERWREADHGIWEIRRNRQHHVHSKVMCWLTVDRAMQVAAYMGHSRPQWADLARTIAAEVLERGWNAERSAFCAAYDCPDTDAATLWVGLSGLLTPDDPRFLATIKAVERDLRVGPSVLRYRYDDGLPGIEGGFNICTTWLIEAYALAGRHDDAEALFDQYIALVGPTGLLPEECDSDSKTGLGNYPQAYSHLGLINAALALDRQRRANRS